jgi:uncharacterized membrane protein
LFPFLIAVVAMVLLVANAVATTIGVALFAGGGIGGAIIAMLVAACLEGNVRFYLRNFTPSCLMQLCSM